MTSCNVYFLLILLPSSRPSSTFQVKIKPSEVKMETSAENLGSKNGGYEEEIKAMEEIGNALKKLEQAGRNNVLQWAINHFLTADSGRTPIFSKTAPVAV